MKLTYIILVCLLCIPLVMATRIEEVKVYVDDELSNSADEDGGDMLAYNGDSIDFLVTIKNDFNVSMEAKIKATIYDLDNGNDIVKEQSWFTIDKEDSRTKGVFFQIPVAATVDDYDVKVVVYYKYSNSTEDSESIDYDLTVRKDSTTTAELDLKSALYNLSINCEGITKGMGSCFGYIGKFSNCTEELSTVKEERGDAMNDASNCKTMLENCNSEKSSCENEKNSCASASGSKLSLDECQIKTNEELRLNNQKNTNNMMLIIALAVGGFFLYNKRKQNATVPDAFNRDRGY